MTEFTDAYQAIDAAMTDRLINEILELCDGRRASSPSRVSACLEIAAMSIAADFRDKYAMEKMLEISIAYLRVMAESYNNLLSAEGTA